MDTFAVDTGLRSDGPQRRYLWTDAFAVGNCLALHVREPGRGWLGLAADLVASVHHVLGRHRGDDVRSGWISGLPEEAGARHPTAGGLRIGKPLPERRPGEPLHPGLEWDRDGQYYHYLTRWMRALHRFSAETGDLEPARWAEELAVAAYHGFADHTAGAAGLAWKMSVDLSRPQVPSTGHLDPLDGLVTAALLRQGADPDRLPRPAGEDRAVPGTLAGVLDGLATLCDGRSWATDDPLGVGGLLEEVALLATFVRRGSSRREGLLSRALDDADISFDALDADRLLALPAERRLAFRELGLSIGLAAVVRLDDALTDQDDAVADWLRPHIRRLAARAPLGERITTFWSEQDHRAVPAWTEHGDINAVMLATALVPDGWLGDIP